MTPTKVYASMSGYDRNLCWMCHTRPFSERKALTAKPSRFVVCEVCLAFQREYIETGVIRPEVPPTEDAVALVMREIGIARELAVTLLDPCCGAVDA